MKKSIFSMMLFAFSISAMADVHSTLTKYAFENVRTEHFNSEVLFTNISREIGYGVKTMTRDAAKAQVDTFLAKLNSETEGKPSAVCRELIHGKILNEGAFGENANVKLEWSFSGSLPTCNKEGGCVLKTSRFVEKYRCGIKVSSDESIIRQSAYERILAHEGKDEVVDNVKDERQCNDLAAEIAKQNPETLIVGHYKYTYVLGGGSLMTANQYDVSICNIFTFEIY